MNAEKPQTDHCLYPWTGDNGTKAQCVANGHCGCGYEKGAFVSGQYAEQQKGDMKDSSVSNSQDGANATPSGTPRVEAAIDSATWGMYADGSDGVTVEEAMLDQLIPLAKKLERELQEAASALTTLTQQLQQMGDKAVPLVNGGASTTASGTLTRKQIEDFRTDGIIRPSDNSGELPAWAIEENLILNTLSDYYLQEAAIRAETGVGEEQT